MKNNKELLWNELIRLVVFLPLECGLPKAKNPNLFVTIPLHTYAAPGTCQVASECLLNDCMNLRYIMKTTG